MNQLFIDLDICSKCDDCGALCSYIQHPSNSGVVALREFAHFALVCRRCDDAPCVNSCPWKALEMQSYPLGSSSAQGIAQNESTGRYNQLKRYMMRCTSCKSCSNACPFGVIYPELIPFLISRCDFCIGRLTEDEKPICLEGCAHGGLKYGEFEENKAERIYRISDNLLVRSDYKWERVEEAPKKVK